MRKHDLLPGQQCGIACSRTHSRRAAPRQPGGVVGDEGCKLPAKATGKSAGSEARGAKSGTQPSAEVGEALKPVPDDARLRKLLWKWEQLTEERRKMIEAVLDTD